MHRWSLDLCQAFSASHCPHLTETLKLLLAGLFEHMWTTCSFSSFPWGICHKKMNSAWYLLSSCVSFVHLFWSLFVTGNIFFFFLETNKPSTNMDVYWSYDTVVLLHCKIQTSLFVRALLVTYRLIHELRQSESSKTHNIWTRWKLKYKKNT